MLKTFQKYIGKNVNVFLHSGSILNGNLKSEGLDEDVREFVFSLDDRWSSRHYFKFSAVEHFWSDEDKPTEN